VAEVKATIIATNPNDEEERTFEAEAPDQATAEAAARAKAPKGWVTASAAQSPPRT
jgi:hypothetical protein